MYSRLVPSTSLLRPFLRMLPPLFPSYFSLPEWGGLPSLIVTMFITFVIPMDRLISSRQFSCTALCSTLLITFYRIPSYSMMTCRVVLISHCRCTFPYAYSTQYKVSCHVQVLP